ncbi:HNH endonuclease [Streptomyces albidoflavus]|uniref:HNH endonuclease n=1 Tax=Streptomyces albidoflavus TaxID=1886 RepID=UPI0033FF791A
METEKTCTKCGETKALEEFSAYRRARDGKKPYCRQCARQYAQTPTQKRAYYAANRERLNESTKRRNRDRYATDPEYRASQITRSVERRRADPAIQREANNRRRARKAAATVKPFTTAELHAAWDEAGFYACYWCDCDFTDSVKMHVDHLVPLDRGGAHAVENLVPACSDCNLSKNAKDPYAFALERYPWLAAKS